MMLNGWKTVVGYIDSCVTATGGGVYEVLLLMSYCKKHLLHFMNDRLVQLILIAIFHKKIFIDTI